MRFRDLILDTCRLFNRLGVEYALIGGYTGILHGSPYMTTDLDFVVEDEGLDFDLLRRGGRRAHYILP